MTTPPQAEQLRASQTTTTVKVGNPAFRYLLGLLCITFACGMAILSVWQKEPVNTALAAIVLVPLVLGFASLSETTFTFVVTILKPFVPRFGPRDDK